MVELAASFDEAWTRFQARDSLRTVGDTEEWEWTQGRAQYLAFLVRVEDTAACEYLARITQRLEGIPGIDVYPQTYWHITIKGLGFQVIKRTREDDVLRQDVPRLAGSARALLSSQNTFDAQLGLASGFAEVAFVELWDEARTARLNACLAEGLPGLARSPLDSPAFLPHVSVARFTSDDGLVELKAAIKELRAQGPGPSFAVHRVELVKAWLSEGPPEFDTLTTYPLRGAR